MKTKKFLVLIVTFVFVFCSNITTFAAEPESGETVSIATESQTRATYLTSGHFSGNHTSKDFYFSNGGYAKSLYLTISGDSNANVYFEVIYNKSGNVVWKDTYKADGTTHKGFFAYLTSGTYHIRFSSTASSTIIYAISSD